MIGKSNYLSSDDHIIMEHDGNKYYDAIEIGRFNIDDVFEEAKIGSFSSSGKQIIILVYGGENINDKNMIPHFHFESTDGSIDGCAKLENAEYFTHGKHKSKLDKNIPKALYKFMESNNKDHPFKTNWEESIIEWRRQNDIDDYNPLILNQPNYSKINNPEYYRLTYDGLGIYEAFKEKVGFDIWKNFLKGEISNWLPKPEKYDEYFKKGYKGYFKYEGYDLFMNNCYIFMNKYIDMRKMKTEKRNEFKSIIYQDTYQIIAK